MASPEDCVTGTQMDVKTNGSKVTKHEKTKRRTSVDQGWAWIVAIGICLWNLIIAGTIKTYGVFYLEFLDLFGASVVATSWISASFTLTLSLGAPFAGLIKDKCSHNTTRVVVAVSTLVAAASYVACAWSRSAIAATMLFGVVAGLASAIIDPSILCCVGLYFVKHRVFANCIAFSGSSIGGFVMPLFFTWAIETYAARGALILLGGFWLNILVVAAIIRPLSTSDTQKIVESAHINETPPKEDVAIITSASSTEEDQRVADVTGFIGNEEVFVMHMGVPVNNADNTKDRIQNGAVRKSECSDKQKTPKVRLTCMDHVKDYWSFIKTPGLFLLCLVSILASLAYFTQFFIIPPLVEELEMSKNFASQLLLILNAIELVSRLLFGLLIEKFRIEKTVILCGSFTISAVAGFFLSFSRTSQAWLIAYVVVLGLLGGLFSPLLLPMLMEISPVDKYGTCAGLYPLLTGIGTTIGPPLVGVTKQYGGSYQRGLLVPASAYVTALLVIVVIYVKNTRRTRSKLSAVTNDINQCTHL